MFTPPAQRPNILVIFTDQQQAAAMSCAGNADLHTPNMDRLAGQGVRFTRAYSTFPLCCPCRASWATGRYPHQINAMTNGSSLPEAEIGNSLGHRMSAAGYHAAWGGKWHVPSIDLAGEAAGRFGFEFVCGFNDKHLARLSADFLRRGHDKPFFLVASFDNPHNICEHSRDQVLPWGDLEDGDPRRHPNLPINFAPPAYEAGILGTRRQAMPPSNFGYTQDRWRRYRHIYYRLVEKVDAQIGRVLDALDESGQADNTVVVFMSDHGDMAGSHGMVQKSCFYEESARVPCIIRDPRAKATAGTTCDALANIGIDLMPTLLDYAGAASDATLPGVSLPGASLPGVSLRPLVEASASTSSPHRRNHIVCESRFDKTDIQARMVRSERFKYVLHSSGQYREMLFDMDNDPGEMVNLAVEARWADVLGEHRKRLLDWCLATGDNFGSHYSHAPYPSIPGFGFDAANPRAGVIPS